jgi:creatinine amidohydrolase
MLAIAPEAVRLDAAEAGPSEPIGALLGRLREHGVIGVSPNGVLGDPTGSSAEEGARLLAEMIADVVDSVLNGDVDGAGRLACFPAAMR